MSRSVVLLLACVLFQGGEKKAPPRLELSSDEQKIVDLTNRERAQKKLPPLTPNALLFQVARAHSSNMARQDKMDHVLDGKDVEQRVLAAGYDYLRVGENLGWSDRIALDKLLKEWMQSKAHREHILDGRFQEIGVGLARNTKGELYYTQVFGTPQPPDE